MSRAASEKVGDTSGGQSVGIGYYHHLRIDLLDPDYVADAERAAKVSRWS
jgi:hypothetical protein